MYLLLLKKGKNDHGPFPTTKAVELYMKGKGQNDCLLVYPGYMSTSLQTIHDFCTKFYVGQNNRIYLLDGCNGVLFPSKKKTSTNPLRISNQHKQELDILAGTNVTTLLGGTKDHSKCIFFFECIERLKECNDTPQNIDEVKCICDENVRIRAALIGSSNWSFNTYYNPTADKGECDVFLIEDTTMTREEILEFYDSLRQEIEEGQIGLFEDMVPHLNLRDLLNEYLGNNNG